MTTEDKQIEQRTKTKPISRFLGGAALGTFAILIPISYTWPMDLNPVNIGFALLLVISCGLLSSIWGGKFIEAAMDVLNSFGS